MNATVNENCIGCGLCAGTCPEVFHMGDDGLAHGSGIPAAGSRPGGPGRLPGQRHQHRSMKAGPVHMDRACFHAGLAVRVPVYR